MSLDGGFGVVKEATEDIKTLASNMKEKVEEQLGETFKMFDAVLYTNQIVAGTNYLIKVKVGDEKFVHIKIYVPLPFRNAPNELLLAEGDKAFLDPLV